MKIAVGSDHAGYDYKRLIKDYLITRGHQVVDFGTFNEQAIDYPDIVRPVAFAVSKGKVDRAIIVGGSGNGEAIAANRLRSVRCTVCWDKKSAELARLHNDSNILSLGQRLISQEALLDIINIWLETNFEGERHIKRLEKIDSLNCWRSLGVVDFVPILATMAWAGRQGGTFEAWKNGLLFGSILAIIQIYMYRKRKWDIDPIVAGLNVFLVAGFLGFFFNLGFIVDGYDYYRESMSIMFVFLVGAYYSFFEGKGFIGIKHLPLKIKWKTSLILLGVTAVACFVSFRYQGDKLKAITLPFLLIFGARGLLRDKILSKGKLT